MTSAAPDIGRSHVGQLDGVRAVAAYGVIATHAGFLSGRSVDRGPFAPLLSRLDFSVTLFFLLSGFLLFRPFAAAAIAGTRSPSAGLFWWRRFLRIMPAYWVVVVVTLGVLTDSRLVTGGEWRSYLTLTQTYVGNDVNPHLSQMWTLVVEISFYAALPLLAVITRRLFRRAELTGQLSLIGALIVGAFVANLVTHRVAGNANDGLLWLPAYLDWFALGMLLAVASCLPTDHAPWRRALAQWAAFPGTCWAVGIGLFWLATLPIAGPRDLNIPTGWEWTTKHLLYGGSAFFLMLPVALGTSPIVRQLLGNRVMRWFGTISYGVFLWHLPLLVAIQSGLGWQLFSGHFLALYLLTAFTATAAAAASWYVLERPVLRRFSRPWRRGGRPERAGERQGEREQAQQLDGRAVADGVT